MNILTQKIIVDSAQQWMADHPTIAWMIAHPWWTIALILLTLFWGLWSDLEQMPRWMKWIDSVTVPKDNPDLSLWKLSTGGLEFKCDR